MFGLLTILVTVSVTIYLNAMIWVSSFLLKLSDCILWFLFPSIEIRIDWIEVFDTALETRFFVKSGSGTENDDFGINECVFSWWRSLKTGLKSGIWMFSLLNDEFVRSTSSVEFHAHVRKCGKWFKIFETEFSYFNRRIHRWNGHFGTFKSKIGFCERHELPYSS